MRKRKTCIWTLAGFALAAVWGCSDDSTPPGGSGENQDLPLEGGTENPFEEGGGPEVETAVLGCSGAFRPVPVNAALRGPYAVGARTVTLANLRAEIWYPAAPESAQGGQPWAYDLRDHLSEQDKAKIPDEANPTQPCDCFRDLPVDSAHGPYPLIWFIHGTAGFRTQTLAQMTHWASRGFVVVSADHPGMELKDILAFAPSNQQAAQAKQGLEAFEAFAGPGSTDALAGLVDFSRIAVAGHSAGGNAAATFAQQLGVKLVIPMAAGGGGKEPGSCASLLLAGTEDGLVPYTNTLAAYEETMAPKRFVGLAAAGHLAFSDICSITAKDGGLLDVAAQYGIVVNAFILAAAQDGCGQDALPPEQGWAITNDATTLALEEALACRADAAERLRTLPERWPEISDYLEALE